MRGGQGGGQGGEGGQGGPGGASEGQARPGARGAHGAHGAGAGGPCVAPWTPPQGVWVPGICRQWVLGPGGGRGGARGCQRKCPAEAFVVKFRGPENRGNSPSKIWVPPRWPNGMAQP